MDEETSVAEEKRQALEALALRIRVGLLAGGTFGLADLIARGGDQGLLVAGIATGALVYFSPHYQEQVKELLATVKEKYEDLRLILPNVWRRNALAGITDEEIERCVARIQKRSPIEDDDEARESDTNEINDEETHNWVNDLDRDTIAPIGQKKTGIFFFSEILATGWRPSWKEIFVGRTMEGKNIFVPALDLCHVAFAGKTGGGKGSLMRLIMVQLCYIGAPVALLNPDYMRWVVAKEGPTFDEDWTPFEGTNPRTDKPYLEKPPVECAEMPTIKTGLKWAATELLESRKQRARTQKVNFVPYFMVIDEWPTIQTELGKEMTGYLGKLLRDGRKYRVYVSIASQDFQVKTMGMEGEGSVRKNFLTVFYTGGDITTRRELLNEETRTTPENKIGKGIVLMRCTGTDNEIVLARVPFVDNESIYTLLGPSTFIDDEYYSDGLENDLDLATSATTTTTAQNEPKTAQNEQESSSSSSSSLPGDWTEKEARMARELSKEIKDKDIIIRILEKKGTIANRRRELKVILGEQDTHLEGE